MSEYLYDKKALIEKSSDKQKTISLYIITLLLGFSALFALYFLDGFIYKPKDFSEFMPLLNNEYYSFNLGISQSEVINYFKQLKILNYFIIISFLLYISYSFVKFLKKFDSYELISEFERKAVEQKMIQDGSITPHIYTLQEYFNFDERFLNLLQLLRINLPLSDKLNDTIKKKELIKQSLLNADNIMNTQTRVQLEFKFKEYAENFNKILCQDNFNNIDYVKTFIVNNLDEIVSKYNEHLNELEETIKISSQKEAEFNANKNLATIDIVKSI